MGFHPWYTDRPIVRPLCPSYSYDEDHGGVAGFEYGYGSDFGFGGSDGLVEPGRSGEAASSSSGATSTGSDQQYLVLSNPFQDREQLESMRRQWQQLPNWKSATVEGLTWEGTAEENSKKYISSVGVGCP